VVAPVDECDGDKELVSWEGTLEVAVPDILFANDQN
jgi:hypothetical protein